MTRSAGKPPVIPGPRFLALRSIAALMLREMAATYGRSPGGYIWALLEPVGMILILSAGLSLFMRTPPLGGNFLLFYATGYLPFSLYMDISSKVSQSLRYSRALLAYPRVSWLDAVISRVILNVLTGAAVSAILITGILAVTAERAILDFAAILAGFAMAATLGCGVGLVNCLLSGLSDLWERIWAIVTRPLFLASGVIYLFEDLPRPAQELLWWNPLIHSTGLARTGFYATYEAGFASMVYGYGTGMLLIAAGLLFLHNRHRQILER